jgi:hypothetical protein
MHKILLGINISTLEREHFIEMLLELARAHDRDIAQPKPLCHIIDSLASLEEGQVSQQSSTFLPLPDPSSEKNAEEERIVRDEGPIVHLH